MHHSCIADASHFPQCVAAWRRRGTDASDVGTRLDVDHDIARQSGLHCAPLAHGGIGTIEIGSAVRLRIGPFNTAIEGGREIAESSRLQALNVLGRAASGLEPTPCTAAGRDSR